MDNQYSSQQGFNGVDVVTSLSWNDINGDVIVGPPPRVISGHTAISSPVLSQDLSELQHSHTWIGLALETSPL